MMIKRMFSIVLPYLLFLLIIFLFQRKMIYFPETHSIEQQQELAKQLNLMLWPSKDNYQGLTSQAIKTACKGTIIVFHGNAGSAINRIYYRIYYREALERQGYRVILAEYPGYGARTGSPSEAALVSAGVQTAKQALNDFGEPIILWGESLGSGVVSGIVQTMQVPIKGIVLVTPFDSLANIAQHHYWFFLAKWLTLDRFNTVKNMRNYTGSTAILLAEKDEIIPNKYSLNLFNSLNPRKKLWTFKDAGHNSLPMEPALVWWKDVIQFVEGRTGVSL
ncbi:MAG: alpha/beta fold hydrolase [Methylobacter sp.]|nr:alpha/beta fold hydrolase [Methylobacter sp.]